MENVELQERIHAEAEKYAVDPLGSGALVTIQTHGRRRRQLRLAVIGLTCATPVVALTVFYGGAPAAVDQEPRPAEAPTASPEVAAAAAACMKEPEVSASMTRIAGSVDRFLKLDRSQSPAATPLGAMNRMLEANESSTEKYTALPVSMASDSAVLVNENDSVAIVATVNADGTVSGAFEFVDDPEAGWTLDSMSLC